MTANTKPTPEKIEQRVLIGTWIRGTELQHLANITPADFEGTMAEIVAKIKAAYYSGIKHGKPITHATKAKLVDDLEAAGYDRKDIYELAEEAAGMEIAYTQAVAQLYDAKGRVMLAGIDYSKPGAAEHARQIIETYTIEGVQGLKAPACDAVEKLRAKMEDPKQKKIIPAGTPKVTRLSGGLRPQDLTIVAGRPGAGKSTYCLQIAIEAYKEELKVMFIPLEMSAEAIAGRMVQAIAYGEVTSDMIRGTAETTEIQKRHLDSAMMIAHEVLNSGRFILLEGEKDLAAIEQQIALYAPDVVIIDQLTQLIDSRESFKSDQIRYKYIHMTRSLKSIAMDTGTSIVLAAQLSRKAEMLSENATPSNDLFKESGSIEEDADRCFILIEKEEDTVDGKYTDIWCTKNRDYKSNFCVHTVFKEDQMTFRETEDNITH